MKFPILIPNIFNYPFTYESKLNLKIGDFVEVPFGKSKKIGVVWDYFEKDNNKNYKTKKIIRKLEIPQLKKKTLDFLNWFSEYNIVPKGMALKLALLSGKPVTILDKKKKYDQDLSDLPLDLPFQLPNNYSSYHLYVIRLQIENIEITHQDFFKNMNKTSNKNT